ncbi:HEWD family protein [Halococcus sediminicola]|uniref:HEWD family protein n=1 Tax=Halococcus sediminicola TaxID=1264579 RepID=UPI000ABD8775|nr:HEWD family protein [Halococcus sediminicola]
MGETLTPPAERECELCGRRDVWDADNWHVVESGSQHCIHEWDINGSYNPLEG